ncbi:MAG: TonB-dependent receptor plug domain-containing protein, partial [Burkholderiales bacterium]
LEVSGRNRGVTFTGKYSTPIIEGHSLVAGWDTGLTKRHEENNQRDIAFPGVLPTITPINANDAFDAELLKLAAFVQDEWNVTKQWSVYMGLRWEGITTTSQGNIFTEVRNRSSVWSPIAQTLYKLPDRKGEQIRLALTRTYKAPSINNLFPRRVYSVDNKPTSPDYQGNPDLRPELATGIDIALEKFWDQGASVSLSAAVRRITDYNRQGLRLISGRWVQTFINDGQAETKSLEFDAKLPLQKFYPTAPGIDFRINMNRNWSSVDSVPGPNNRLDAQTPFSGTAGLDYRMKNGVVSAGGSYSFRSGGDVRTGINQSAYLTAKRDLDIYALWKVTPKTQLRLTLSNILKPSSVNENTYFDAFGRTVTSTNTPSKPNVRLGLEVKL